MQRNLENMSMSGPSNSWIRASLIGALSISPVAVPTALGSEGLRAIEEVVVTGSRRPGRTATESTVPVDVFDGNDFAAQGTSDMDDLMRNLVPSYNVQRLPISDAASISRPATLRGLPPDNTLILVNGKRWHRGAVIAELGGSLAAGSQGPDLASIPAIALKQVEVLRDGAAAQYGSDAIAGVINFQLKDDNEGMTFEAKWGETYKGDGDAMQLAANIGLPLGPNGFANVSLQWKEQDLTSRSVQRNDAAGLIATGNTAVANPAQPWGSPEIKDDYTLFINSGIDLTENQTLYAFGHYAQRDQSNGFFYRNPNNRSGVFTGPSLRRAIIDTNYQNIVPDPDTGRRVSNCPLVVSPGGSTAGTFNPATLPANCFVYNSQFPGGFTPTFGAELEDISGAVGMRGTFANGLLYDFSMRLARNEVGFFLENTLNPSLGPNSPTSFDLGKYLQTEQNYNAEFSYPLAVEAFHSDLNVAFGVEYRVEMFEIRLGEESSWKAGPYAFQDAVFHADGVTPLVAMSIGANGFAGFSPNQSGEFDRANYAAYVDLEADVVERWTVGAALRFEDFDDFGTTTNGKLSTRYQFVDNFAARASFSTGFRAPTPGQANVTKVSTRTVDGVLQQAGQIPPTNPIAVLLGGKQLKPEDATNWTVGFVWDVTDALTVTADYFNIEVTDRISNTGLIRIADQTINGVPLPVILEQSGIPGARDLESVDFYVNDFDTTTQGIDLVATYVQDWGDIGITNFTLAWNWTETEIDQASAIISRNRRIDLENFNPENRGVFTINHAIGDIGLLLRANYYDDWVVGNNSAGTSQIVCSEAAASGDRCYDGAWVFDAEVSYTFQSRYTFVVGAQNAFDTYPDKDPNRLAGGNSGNKYTTSSPWGMDGGFWYLRFRADLN
jgi:iron complex outermembrane recepter protein